MIHIVIPCDEYNIHLYTLEDQVPPSLLAEVSASERLLKESGNNWKSIKGPYRYRIDGPHDANTGQRHLHVYKKDNELFSLNWDGSGHDNSRGHEIPNKVYDYLIRAHPDLTLPANRIIESIHTGGRIIKFSQFFKLRASDPAAMKSLNDAISLLEEFKQHHGAGGAA